MNPLSALDPKLAVPLNISKHALGKFLGKYQSLFRGRGIDYDEIRPYAPGDDPKAFVWAKLAQLHEPYVKTFLEERDLSVCIALDVSGSMIYKKKSKEFLALRAASLLIYSAALSRDRVGLALFSDHLERFIPPRRGMQHAGTLIEILASVTASNAKTDIRRSFREIGSRGGSKRGVLFIISDFISQETSFEHELDLLASSNDVVLIRVFDSFEKISAPGWIVAKDPEEKSPSVVHLGHRFGERSVAFAEEEYQRLVLMAAHAHVPLCNLPEDCDPIAVLHDFFARQCDLARCRGG